MKITNGSCQRVITQLVRIEQPKTDKLSIMDNATKTTQNFSSKFGELCFRFKSFIKSCGKCMFSSKSRKEFYDDYVKERVTARSSVSSKLYYTLENLDPAKLSGVGDKLSTTLADIWIDKNKTEILCKKNGTCYEFSLRHNSEPPKLVIKITEKEFANFVKITSIIKEYHANLAQKAQILEILHKDYGCSDKNGLLAKCKKKEYDATDKTKISLAKLDGQQIELKKITEEYNLLNSKKDGLANTIQELNNNIQRSNLNIEEKDRAILKLKKKELAEDKVSRDAAIENKKNHLDKATEYNKLQHTNMINTGNLAILMTCAKITNEARSSTSVDKESLEQSLSEALDCFAFDEYTCKMTLGSIQINSLESIKEYFLEENSSEQLIFHGMIIYKYDKLISIVAIQGIQFTLNAEYKDSIAELSEENINVNLVEIQEGVKLEHVNLELGIKTQIENLSREKEDILRKREVANSERAQFSEDQEKIEKSLSTCEFLLKDYQAELNKQEREVDLAKEEEEKILADIVEIKKLLDTIDAIDKWENDQRT